MRGIPLETTIWITDTRNNPYNVYTGINGIIFCFTVEMPTQRFVIQRPPKNLPIDKLFSN